MNKKTVIIRTAVWSGIALLLSGGFAWIEAVRFEGAFGCARIISDGCFLGGLAVCCMWGFAFAGRNGAFDLFSYSVGRVAHSFKHRDGVKEKSQGYFEYVEAKQNQKKEKAPLWPIVAVGGFFILAGVFAAFVFAAID